MWVRTTLADFRVGDRIRFTDESSGERVEAAVTHVLGNELCTDHRHGWYVGTHGNGQLYKWVEDVVAVEWQEVQFPEIIVGDYIEFLDGRNPATDNRVRGTVEAFEYQELHVRRDDGRRGGGLGGTFLVWSYNGPFKRRGATIPTGPVVPPPRRAVFCACCALPTGQFSDDENIERYCIGCRNLPGPWRDRHGEATGRRVNDGTGAETYYDQTREAAARIRTLTETMPPTTHLYVEHEVGTAGYDEDEAEDEDTHGVACIECGYHCMRVEGVEYTQGTTTTHHYYTDDAEPGQIIYFELDYDDIEVEVVPGTGRVVCHECGTHQPDVRWELA